MRYEGQNYEIDVPFDPDFDVNDLKTRFDERHKQLYGFSSPEVFHEIINLRSTIIGKIRGIDLTRKGNRREQDPFKARRKVFFSEHGGFIESDIYERDYLQPDFEIEGPAIIEELDSTILIPSHYQAKIDNLNNVILFPRR
jgi:N-methylhydantoinase A